MKLIHPLALAMLLSGCASTASQTKAVDPAATGTTAQAHATGANAPAGDHGDHEWYECPHEGGHYHAPGKCTNTWCGLELVKKTK